MPTFEWKGRSRAGDTAGVLVADTKDAVIATLRRQQIVVTAVKEKGKELAFPKFGGRVPPQLIAIFTRQFSVMIEPVCRWCSAWRSSAPSRRTRSSSAP